MKVRDCVVDHLIDCSRKTLQGFLLRSDRRNFKSILRLRHIVVVDCSSDDADFEFLAL